MRPFDIDQIAQLAHEANRAYCLAIGDASQPAWADAPDWQKSSARNGVIFHLNNPGAGPEASHESWLEQKRAEGWTYGPVKDPKKREHPCFVPYGELPVEQRAKDFIFRSIVHTALNLPEERDYDVQSSEEMASLGGAYMSLTDEEIAHSVGHLSTRLLFCDNVRSLAACVVRNRAEDKG